MKLRAGSLVIALLSLLTLNSCVREYICECEISYSGKPGLPDTVIKRYDVKDTKKNAEALCEDNSSTSEKDGIKTVENCYLF